MSDVLNEMLRRDAVLSGGLAFIVTGLLLALLPRLLKAPFALRDRRAAMWRGAGRVEDAARLQQESVLFRRRLVVAARGLIGFGLVATILALFIGQ